MRNNIFVLPVLCQKASRYDSQLNEAQLFIKFQSICIAAHHSIKLEDTKAQLLPFLHAVFYQIFSDMLPTRVRAHRIACVADMAAPPDIVRMKDIESKNLSGNLIISKPGEGLFFKKSCPLSSVNGSVWGNAVPSSTTLFQIIIAPFTSVFSYFLILTIKLSIPPPYQGHKFAGDSAGTARYCPLNYSIFSAGAAF